MEKSRGREGGNESRQSQAKIRSISLIPNVHSECRRVKLHIALQLILDSKRRWRRTCAENLGEREGGRERASKRGACVREGDVERVNRAIEREGDQLFGQIAIDVGARAAMGNVIAHGCVHAKNGASVSHFALYLHPVARPNRHLLLAGI